MQPKMKSVEGSRYASEISKRNRKKWEPQPEPAPEHPDDKADRERAEQLAVKAIDKFMSRIGKDVLREMVLVYQDEKAERLLVDLRDSFWSSL